MLVIEDLKNNPDEANIENSSWQRWFGVAIYFEIFLEIIIYFLMVGL